MRRHALSTPSGLLVLGCLPPAHNGARTGLRLRNGTLAAHGKAASFIIPRIRLRNGIVECPGPRHDSLQGNPLSRFRYRMHTSGVGVYPACLPDPPRRALQPVRRPREGRGRSLTPDATATGGEGAGPPGPAPDRDPGPPREPRLGSGAGDRRGPGRPPPSRGQAGDMQCEANGGRCVNPVARLRGRSFPAALARTTALRPPVLSVRGVFSYRSPRIGAPLSSPRPLVGGLRSSCGLRGRCRRGRRGRRRECPRRSSGCRRSGWRPFRRRGGA